MSSNASMIGADDMLSDGVPDVPLWNETMAGIIDDPVSGISAMLYIGRWWQEPTTLRQMIAFALPDGRALFAKNYARSPIARVPQAGSLLMLAQGDGTIRYTYDGPMDLRSQSEVSINGMTTGPTVRAKFDINFRSDFPIWDIHAKATHDQGADFMFRSGHMEQLGLFDGKLEFGDEAFALKDATGVRDHSRGPRDSRGHVGHMWVNAQFPSGWGFYCFLVKREGTEGFTMRAAAISKGDTIYEAEVDSDGIKALGRDIWEPFTIRLKAEGVGSFDVNVTGLRHCYQIGKYDPADLYWGVPNGPATPEAYWVMEQGGNFVCDGEAGFGHVERCDRSLEIEPSRWAAMCADDRIARK